MVLKQYMETKNLGLNATRLPKYVNRVLDPSNPNNPFFIGANKNLGALLVTQMSDSSNYHQWVKSMKRALGIKN